MVHLMIIEIRYQNTVYLVQYKSCQFKNNSQNFKRQDKVLVTKCIITKQNRTLIKVSVCTSCGMFAHEILFGYIAYPMDN